MASAAAQLLNLGLCPPRISLPSRTSCISHSDIQIRTRASNPKVPPSPSEEIEETEKEPNPALVSRRWAAVVLPLAAILGSGAIPSSAATVGDVPSTKLENGAGRVQLRTLGGCGLGVAGYPDFVYNAEGGGGSGEALRQADGRTLVHFDAERLYIPAVGFSTTKILGLPLPPGLKIQVVPKILEGYVEEKTGKVELNFLANFYFTAGPLYHPPPLVVDTILTTESSQGVFRRGEGQRLDASGNVKLVAVARLAPINDRFLSTFLTLPTDCLAELSANLSFS